jgi:tetratricopeptide (TPR) repeat protein
MLLAAFNLGPSHDPLILSIGLPGSLAVGIEAAAGFIFAMGGLIAFAPIARRSARRVLIAPLTLYSTQALWFVAPIVVGWMSSLSAPQTRYSSGMLAVMHSAQYLWITRYFARRDAEQPGRLGSWSVWAYWSTLVIGGLALFLPVPWFASYSWHADFTVSVFIVASIVNIHHFMIDGVVWKLRNPRVGQMLVGGSSAQGAGATTPVAAMPQLARRRMLTAARYAAVALLLMLAAVDQWRYRLAIGPGDRDGLEAATRINPHDSGAYLRLAQAAGRAGDADGAEAAVRRAIAANPHSPIPARALVRLLIESNRLPDAYAQAQAVLASWPSDVDTLVNAGVLAYRLNDMVAAEESWRRALDQDPSQRAVHLYLAERLDARGALAEALPHYRRYLELAVSADADDRPPAAEVVPAVLKFADALARQGDRGAALSQYDLAVRMAQQTGLGDIERIAQERRDAIAAPR